MTNYSPAIFEQYLVMIGDSQLQDAIREALQETPRVFWTNPASKTGRYHPKQSLGTGGLIRHTLRALQFFVGVRPTEPRGTFAISEEDFWCGIAALMLHDCQKQDYKTHCEDGAAFVIPFMVKHNVREHVREKVIRAMQRHMGPFSDGLGAAAAFKNEQFTRLEWAVYMADLYSAQRWLQDAEV